MRIDNPGRDKRIDDTSHLGKEREHPFIEKKNHIIVMCKKIK